jgi:hypothetical protein
MKFLSILRASAAGLSFIITRTEQANTGSLKAVCGSC